MKAAILAQLKSPLIVDDIELPTDLSFGQVLVKVLVSGVCGSQIGEVDGIKGEDRFLPHLLGHEGCGEVMAVGRGVSRVKQGDRVVMHWRKGLGIESLTPQYKWGDKLVNGGWVTTFNEFAVVSENRLTLVHPDVDPEVAALMGCAVTTGLGVINNNAKLKIGQSIAVFGAGGVGLNIIQGAAMVAADPIIAIDIFDHKLEMAKRYGATHVVNSRKNEPLFSIKKIVGGSGVDVAVDNTGLPDVIQAAYTITSDSGRTVLVGVPRKDDNISIYSLPLHFSKVLTGSHGGESNPTVDIPRYLNLYEKGKLEFKGMITHRYKLRDINQAIAELREGKVGRCIISMI